MTILKDKHKAKSKEIN